MSKNNAAIVIIPLITGCIATTGDGPLVGPGSSSQILESTQTGEASPLPPHGRNIEVAIPVFEPNIPANSDDWEKKAIWPELRRAESKRFAIKMKEALDDTRQFGAVRVVPNQSATGDLYILGKIEESNGEDVKIHIKAVGIDGKTWLSQTFKHRVKEAFFHNIRNQDKSPYEPAFEEAAQRIVEKLKTKDNRYLDDLNTLTEVRFGYSLSEETYAPFIKISGNKMKLISAPADEDAMLQRIRKLRIKDQLFIDSLQPHYEAFDAQLSPSYTAWQKAAFTESKAKREARVEATGKAILGTLLLVAGAVAAANSSNSQDPNTAGVIAGVAGATAGGYLLLESHHASKESKLHHQTLMELGRDIDVRVAPQVVEFEKQTVKLIGDDKEQFDQWRHFLKKIYNEEATPSIQL